MSIEPDDPTVMGPLNELIDRAIAQKKWLFHNSMTTGPLWFSPEELRERNRKGEFRWGVINWELRNPMEYLHIETTKARDASDRLDDVVRRIATWAGKQAK